MNEASVQIRARELRVGDYLTGSRQTVMSVSGVFKPRDDNRYKVQLRLFTKGGAERVARFGAETTLRVVRAEA